MRAVPRAASCATRRVRPRSRRPSGPGGRCRRSWWSRADRPPAPGGCAAAAARGRRPASRARRAPSGGARSRRRRGTGRTARSPVDRVKERAALLAGPDHHRDGTSPVSPHRWTRGAVHGSGLIFRAPRLQPSFTPCDRVEREGLRHRVRQRGLGNGGDPLDPGLRQRPGEGQAAAEVRRLSARLEQRARALVLGRRRRPAG